MPYKPEQREYRSFAAALAPVPQTSDERGAYTVEGYATTFDDAYELYRDYDGNPVYERISRDALVGADMSDVIFLLNHDGAPLARLRNGSLEVVCDEHGICVRARLGGSRGGPRPLRGHRQRPHRPHELELQHRPGRLGVGRCDPHPHHHQGI